MSQDKVVVKVSEICGSHCVWTERALTLFSRIQSALGQGTEVRLDFAGVWAVSTSFMNCLVGNVIGQVGSHGQDELFSWQGLDESHDELMRLVIRNAKEHFSKSEEKLSAERDIIREAVEENNHG